MNPGTALYLVNNQSIVTAFTIESVKNFLRMSFGPSGILISRQGSLGKNMFTHNPHALLVYVFDQASRFMARALA